MIKVKVIEKEVEEKQIYLKDCNVGDVVDMGDDITAVVVDAMGVIHESYHVDGKGIVLLGGENCYEMGEEVAQEAIEGGIKRIIGKLTGIEVTAK